MTALNTVKAGSTVPLKFNVFAGTTEKTATSDVVDLKVSTISCQDVSAGGEDPIEQVATGGTSLRYDATAGQFIQNWQTPKTSGGCYRVVVTTRDGGSITANFKLK